MQMTTRLRLYVAIALFSVAPTIVGCTSSGGPSAKTSEPAATTAASKAAFVGASGQIPDIVEDVTPSTVSIHTDVGNGSGVIWDATGTVVTNEHVLRGASRYTVSLADGTPLQAKLVADDPITDLAVLRVDRKGLPPATFQSDLPRVGELAIAIGNPLGLSGTVSAGIVSSLNRNIPGSATQSAALVDLIQTDVAISPGNSGGALVNGRGEVIGINVAYLPPETGAVSIGFAIPSATVKDVVDQLLRTGTVSHAFMGLSPVTLTAQIRDSLGVHANSGVVVQSVVAGGPAATAGIEPGDVITGIGDHRIANAEQFLAALRTLDPAEVAEVTLVRGTSEHTTKVTVTNRPPTG